MTGMFAATAVTFALLLAGRAAASPLNPSGVVRVVNPGHVQLNAGQSSNWFGYQAGTIERGGTLFNSISADWIVPRVSPHAAGQAGDSATWIGIGGGCLDPSCGLADATLIQAGTEQDVDSSGHSTYSAWWELVPTPATTIGSVNPAPGDHIHVTIAEASPNAELWTITLKDKTSGQSFSTTVPYTSTHTTAEWIDETPLTLGSDAVGQASLPNMTETEFTDATVNGAPAHLTSGEQVQLVDGSGAVIGTPSAPLASATAFADCAWAQQCAVTSLGSAITLTRKSAHRHRRHHRHHHRRHRRHRHHTRHRRHHR